MNITMDKLAEYKARLEEHLSRLPGYNPDDMKLRTLNAKVAHFYPAPSAKNLSKE